MLRVPGIGRPTANSIRVLVATTRDSAVDPISAVASAGSVAITQPAQTLVTISAPLQVGFVDVTGLPAHSPLTVTVSQNGEDDQVCTLKTLPDDEVTDFSFIMTTCDFLVSKTAGNLWRELNDLIDTENILFRVNPDDYTYVDGLTMNKPPYTSTGVPGTTKDPDDYNLAYGVWAGVFDTYYEAHDVERQDFYKRVPVLSTGGDHYVKNDYRRSTDVPEDSVLYAAAKDGWENWAAPLNPDPLAVGELWFGFTCGPCRFVFSEMENTCIPPVASETDKPCYTQPQIDDWFNYWDTDPVQFNFLCSERMTDQTQQGWRQLHQDEADGWKASMEANNNLNGVNGNLTALTGDRHCQMVIQYDSFAEMVPSQCAGQDSVGAELYGINWAWGGVLKHAIVTRDEIGDRPEEGFILFRVKASAATPFLEMIHYQTMNGTLQQTYGPSRLNAGAEDNQWVLPDNSDRIGREVQNSGAIGQKDRFVMPGETIAQGSRDDYLGFYIFQGDNNSYLTTLNCHVGAVSETVQARFKLTLFEYDFGGTQLPTKVVGETEFQRLPVKVGAGARQLHKLPIVGGELRLGPRYYIIGISVEDAPVSVSDDTIGVVGREGAISV